MNIAMLEDRVLLKLETKEQMTAGGLHIPDTAIDAPQTAKVIAVGPGKVSYSGDLIPTTCKYGDKVVFGKYSGTEVELDDENYLIIREADILAILAPEEDELSGPWQKSAAESE